MIDDRKNKVLQAIVEDYVATAEPVGSRTIARKYNLGVSPATIRNEMSDLEDMGYLEQPHTSAGRVPSDLGYRYYVDCLMPERSISPAEHERIRQTFQRKIREVDTLIRETARLLSDTTQLTAVISGPQFEKAVFKEIRLVPLGRDRALLIYITDRGLVENQVVEVPVEVTMLEFQQVAEILNEQLRGHRMDTLPRTVLQALQRELSRYGSLLEQALYFLEQRLEPGERHRLYLGGTTRMLDQPEFRDVEKLRGVLSFLEQEDAVATVIGVDKGTEGVEIQIGEEIRLRELADCSIVTATYRLGDEIIGKMGVIGPRRMEYPKVVAILNAIASYVSELNRRF